LAADVLGHRQSYALHRYLAGLPTPPQTIVTEERYVDSDYLADYGAFYGSVFTAFDRFCRRVHFFSSAFELDEFERFILATGTQREADHNSLNAVYLGFTVVRPLPQAFIGRTIIRVDATASPLRKFTAVIQTHVNLFGIELTLPDSLPFQQQDNVVSACASVALWSAFHKTADLFGTPRPRPAEITRTATANTLDEARSFPSRALTTAQICDAIRANGLDFERYSVTRGSNRILSFSRAYLKAGLPVILAVRLPDESYHAVTAVGYEVSPLTEHQFETEQLREAPPSVGQRIRSLFCQDDNIGPFTRYEICTPENGNSPVSEVNESGAVSVRVAEYDDERPMTLHSAIVPVHPSIRLDFASVQVWVEILDRAIRGTSAPKPENSVEHAEVFNLREWDVALVRNDVLRADILKLKYLSAEARLALLTKDQPRYLWQAVMRFRGHDVVRFYLDATSFSRAVPLWRFIFASRHWRTGAITSLPALFENGAGVVGCGGAAGIDRGGAYADQAKALWRFLVAEGTNLGEPD
jgi:hypothetical protein